MQAITQLKSLRDEARVRIQANPDYRLLTSLDKLIVDLEGMVGTSLSVVEPSSLPSETVIETFKKISAEIGSESANGKGTDRMSLNA